MTSDGASTDPFATGSKVTILAINQTREAQQVSDVISVLVVEDEPLIRLEIVDYLEQCGFRVRDAGTAALAIAILEADTSIQVLFTDIDMPGGMDGLVLSAAVRKRWPPIKIIVTSGKRLVEITDLPDGSMFFAKPYRSPEVGAACLKLVADQSPKSKRR